MDELVVWKMEAWEGSRDQSMDGHMVLGILNSHTQSQILSSHKGILIHSSSYRESLIQGKNKKNQRLKRSYRMVVDKRQGMRQIEDNHRETHIRDSSKLGHSHDDHFLG